MRGAAFRAPSVRSQALEARGRPAVAGIDGCGALVVVEREIDVPIPLASVAAPQQHHDGAWIIFERLVEIRDRARVIGELERRKAASERGEIAVDRTRELDREGLVVISPRETRLIETNVSLGARQIEGRVARFELDRLAVEVGRRGIIAQQGLSAAGAEAIARVGRVELHAGVEILERLGKAAEADVK